MEANEKISLFSEISAEESATVSGGATAVNFDLNTYLFVIGAGAVFNGGVTTNVVNQAFNRAVSTPAGGTTTSPSSGGGTGGGGGSPTNPILTNTGSIVSGNILG